MIMEPKTERNNQSPSSVDMADDLLIQDPILPHRKRIRKDTYQTSYQQSSLETVHGNHFNQVNIFFNFTSSYTLRISRDNNLRFYLTLDWSTIERERGEREWRMTRTRSVTTTALVGEGRQNTVGDLVHSNRMSQSCQRNLHWSPEKMSCRRWIKFSFDLNINDSQVDRNNEKRRKNTTTTFKKLFFHRWLTLVKRTKTMLIFLLRNNKVWLWKWEERELRCLLRIILQLASFSSMTFQEDRKTRRCMSLKQIIGSLLK